MPYIYLPDNTPSRNYGRNTSSSTFGGSFSNAGSDPRERGRQRGRKEIEASSRAEHLAKKEHLAKLREMNAKRVAEETDKKTSEARAKVLARPDVQAELDRKEEMRLANEARKNKPLERLTPEQSLAKGQAEKRQRDDVERAATERRNADARSRTATMDKLMSERMKPEGPSLGDTLAASETAGRKALASNAYNTVFGPYAEAPETTAPAKPAAPAQEAANTFGPPAPAPHPSTVMRVFSGSGLTPQTERNPNRMNHFGNDSPEQRRNIEQELMNPSGRARPVAKPAQPVQGLLAASAAEENMAPKDREFVQGQRRAYQTAALPYSFPAGLAQYYGGEGGKQLMSDTMDKLAGIPESISNMFGSEEYKPGPGGQKMLDDAADFLEPRVSPTIDAGVQYIKEVLEGNDRLSPYEDAARDYITDRISDVGSGAQRMADQAAEYLEPRVSPAIDAATRYGQQKFSDTMTAVNRPLAEGGLRFDPGVHMPPQREVGGVTGGSLGAPTAPREGMNPTSFDSFLDSLLPPAYPNAMSAEQASMKANDAWRAEMARAEAAAEPMGPPAPKQRRSVRVKRRRSR